MIINIKDFRHLIFKESAAIIFLDTVSNLHVNNADIIIGMSLFLFFKHRMMKYI